MQQAQLFCDDTYGNDKARKRRTNALVREIKSCGIDYEFYPTQQREIDVIKQDIIAFAEKSHSYFDTEKLNFSVLDAGAGDGRVLAQLTNGPKYAIELALPLINAMPKDIFVIGRDFREQTLMDKPVDIIFANPPYSDFESWASKVILEGNAALAYLIMPQRWINSQSIKDALAARKFSVDVIDTSDYLFADRKARAKVDIVRIKMGSFSSRNQGSYCKNDPFDVWFDAHFPLNAPATEVSKWEKTKQMEEEVQKNVGASDVTKKEGLVKLLDQLYQRDLAELMQTYQSMSKIPGDLLRELEINIAGVKASLRLKIKTLKNVYWQQLFDGLHSVTDKLCYDSRAKLLKRLTSHTNVDFNSGNAVAVIIWVIKQANTYFDEQIINVFQSLTEAANVVLYKSNERTIKHDRWRYSDERYSALGEYGLDYRLVLESQGGYKDPACWSNSTRCGLADRAAILVGDLVTIANNIGFDATGNIGPLERRWLPGKPQLFYFFDHKTQEQKVLFEVKAYIKGTIHIRLHESFIQSLNCIHGRLKGWIKCASDAVNEIGIPAEVAEQAFALKLQIQVQDVLMLSGPTQGLSVV